MLFLPPSCVSFLVLSIIGCQGTIYTAKDATALEKNSKLVIPDTVPRGIQVRLTESGLRFLAKIEVLHFKEELQNLKIPDASGGGECFSYSATKILIKKLQVKTQSMTTLPGVGLMLAIGGITLPASATVTIKYHKGWVKLSDTTQVDIVASGIDFSLALKIDAKNGKPYISTQDCISAIKDIQLHFKGGLSWLYELLREYLGKKLKAILLDKLCEKSGELIDGKVNEYIKMIPFRKNVKDFAYLDYGFEQPLFEPSYLDLYLRGEFLDFHHPVHSHLVPTDFTTTSSSRKMIYIWLSDYSLNTAAEVFHKAQLLQKVIKVGDQIPPGVKPFLNTKSLKQFIPQLYRKYPNRPIQITLQTFKPPTFSLRDGSARIYLYVRAGINVVLQNSVPENTHLVEVFHIDMSVGASVIVAVKTVKKHHSLGGRITYFNFRLSVGGSIIGKVSLPVDNQSIKDMVHGLVVDQANPILDQGFPLPYSNYLELKELHLVLIKNAIQIDANVDYHLHGNRTITGFGTR